MPNITPIPQDPIVFDGKWSTPSWISWFNRVYLLLKGSPYISNGIIAPTSTPQKIGDMYIDTVLSKVYVATGTTNSSDWKILN